MAAGKQVGLTDHAIFIVSVGRVFVAFLKKVCL